MASNWHRHPYQGDSFHIHTLADVQADTLADVVRARVIEAVRAVIDELVRTLVEVPAVGGDGSADPV